MPGEPRPFFGRAFKLQVIHAPDTATQSTTTLADSTWKGESLRIEFETEQVAVSSAYWSADISIYNSTIAMQAVLQKGDSVSLIAGYDSEQGVIFEGKLWQPMWDRPDSVTSQLKLRCFVSLLEMQAVYVTVTVAAGSTQLDAVKIVADAAGIKNRNLDEAALTTKQFPRGRTIVGDAMKFFCEVAKDNGLQCWLDFHGLNLRALSSNSDVPDVVYAPPNITT
jgi:hypothetical protein